MDIFWFPYEVPTYFSFFFPTFQPMKKFKHFLHIKENEFVVKTYLQRKLSAQMASLSSKQQLKKKSQFYTNSLENWRGNIFQLILWNSYFPKYKTQHKFYKV